MGWELAGLKCARGRTERFAPGTPQTAALALDRAKRFAEDSGVGVIGALDLARLQEDPTRTLYILDVRDPEEFRAGHRAGSVSAPGGQLVQATDRWIGVRHARIALIDDTGVRARMTGAWLRQMGHADVFAVEGGLEDELVTSPPRPAAGAAIEPMDLMAGLGLPGSIVVDLARSVEFREGHIPGALWGIRSRLDRLQRRLAPAEHVTLTCPDGVLARLAVPEVQALTNAAVRVLHGGTQAWRQAGGALVANRADPPDEDCADFYLRPYDRNSGVEAAMHAYLSWEIDLVHEIARDGTVHFGVGAHAVA
jgi:rhodanese-related sulfurtransferase